VRKTKTRTLLTNKKDAIRTSSRAGVRLEKIPDGSLSTKAGGNKALSVDPGFERAMGANNEEANFTLPLTLKNQRITKQE
jgi:hypothetical protein